MAKSREKNIALELRKKGKSLKEISNIVKVSKSTISLWCRDIELTPVQISRLRRKMNEAAYKGARMQYRQRLQKIKEGKKRGKEQIKKLSQRELLLAGLSLYWGEGAKKTRQVRVSNSDPGIINFMIKWFRQVWKIEPERFALRISINNIHKQRIKEVEKCWSRRTGIPRKQIRKTTLIKTKNKKQYNDFPKHYGTARLEIRKPAEIYYKIMGLIDAFSRAGE